MGRARSRTEPRPSARALRKPKRGTNTHVGGEGSEQTGAHPPSGTLSTMTQGWMVCSPRSESVPHKNDAELKMSERTSCDPISLRYLTRQARLRGQSGRGHRPVLEGLPHAQGSLS